MSLRVISRRRGTITAASLAVALLVLTPAALAAPANDNFANAKVLRLGKIVKGSINGATKQSGEPRHANSLATHSVWYRLRVKHTMTVAVNTCDATFDTVLAAYSGRSLRGLKVVQFNNDGCNASGGSRLTFRARKGVTYRLAVVGFADKGTFRIGAFKLSVPPNDYFADAVPVNVGDSLAGTTLNATRELGEPRHRFNRAHTVWFTLSVTAQTIVEAAACGADGVSVYTGGSITSLTPVTPTTDIPCGVRFTAQPAVTYRVVVEAGGSGRAYRLTTAAVTPSP
jgi:hypothetical protein